jgi:CubicO group peptidase (beta-lactamase class C family)
MGMDRRSFLRAGGALSLAGLLAACGDDDDAQPATTAGAASTTARSSTSVAASTTTAATTTTTSGSSATLPTMDDATMATLDRVFAEQFAATGLAGLAGVVRIGDGVWSGSTGVVDLTTKEPFRAKDFVRIASI